MLITVMQKTNEKSGFNLFKIYFFFHMGEEGEETWGSL